MWPATVLLPVSKAPPFPNKPEEEGGRHSDDPRNPPILSSPSSTTVRPAWITRCPSQPPSCLNGYMTQVLSLSPPLCLPCANDDDPAASDDRATFGVPALPSACVLYNRVGEQDVEIRTYNPNYSLFQSKPRQSSAVQANGQVMVAFSTSLPLFALN